MANYLERNRTINLRELLEIIREIALILDSLHDEGIVHRSLTLEAIRIKHKNKQFKMIIERFDSAIKLK